MDKDVILNQFDQIEKKINSLIEVNARLESENAALRQNNEELERQLQDMMEAEEKNNEVKALIRSKIDSLMGRLDGITESSGNMTDVEQ